MKKTFKILFLVLIIFSVVSQIFNIWLVNSVDAQSIAASRLQSKIERLREQNSIIETEVWQYASYSNVASRAATLGFGNKKDFITLGAPQKLAIR